MKSVVTLLKPKLMQFASGYFDVLCDLSKYILPFITLSGLCRSIFVSQFQGSFVMMEVFDVC